MKSQILHSLIHLTLIHCVVAAENTLIENPSTDNSPGCDCYLTSGPDPGYFQYHRFFDFRDIPNDGNNDFTQAPPLVTTPDITGNETITSSYFNTTFFTDNWALQSWSREYESAWLTQVASYQNVYISRNTTQGSGDSTYLALRTNRLPGFQSSAEIDSNQNNILHSSIRARLRVVPNGFENVAVDAEEPNISDQSKGSNSSHPIDAGAVVGFFTYESDTEESDIEILTQDPIDTIHYSNQPDYNAKTDDAIEGASTVMDMPDNTAWTEWVDHRIDWFDGMSRWYVNDELVLNKSENVPTKPSALIFNLWSNGGTWSGNMTVGGQVVVGIEWIEMAFNVSGDVQGPNNNGKRSLGKRSTHCQVGCWMDGPNVTQVGFPQLAFNSTSAAGRTIADGQRSVALVTGFTFAVLFGVLL